ncbi:MAG: hypothetical protein BWY36_00641 [Candidatus Diapherotrites archaeon ADurb.Bin253]|nr:MAG: hypothetical protein BWY36_00641 [Candidatus Diapherotrites archaeon ADurb.Bin253]
MKKTLKIFLCIFAFSTFALHGEDIGNIKETDGTDWNEFADLLKVTWVHGFITGTARANTKAMQSIDMISFYLSGQKILLSSSTDKDSENIKNLNIECAEIVRKGIQESIEDAKKEIIEDFTKITVGRCYFIFSPS